MSDENSTPVGGNQTTTSTQNPVTTDGNQSNNDFVLDFGEGEIPSTENLSDKDDNLQTSSNGNNIEDSEGNYVEAGLNDNNGDDKNNDFNISLDNSSDNNTSPEEFNGVKLDNEDNESADTKGEPDLDSDFQLNLDSTDNSGEVYDEPAVQDKDSVDKNSVDADSVYEDSVDEIGQDENPVSEDSIEIDDGDTENALDDEDEFSPDSQLEDSHDYTTDDGNFNDTDTKNQPQDNKNIGDDTENNIFSPEDNSQASELNQFKIINQPDSPIETQPNIQDYQDNTSNDTSLSFEETEDSQSTEPENLNNNPDNEDNFINTLNYPGFEAESQDTKDEEPQSTDQETSIQENTENGNLLNLNSENESNNYIDTYGENGTKEDFITSPQTSLENNSPQIDNISTTQESQENQINSYGSNEISNNETDISQMQSTLSLDQILDSELSSNPKYSNNSIIMTESKDDNKNSFKSKKINTILVGIGIFILTGLVVVLAFPSGNTNRKPGDEIENTGNVHNVGAELYETNNSGDITPDPIKEIDFPDPTTTSELEDQTTPTNPGNTATSTVVFPEAFDEDENTQNDKQNQVAIPYVENYDYENKDDEQEIENLKTIIMESISSFKSQGERYYSFGSANSNRKIIKYALQIIDTCEIYETEISKGEGINQESLNEFNNKVNGIITKIEDYNNGGDDSIQIIQNNIETNEKNDESSEINESYDSEEKELLKEFLYSK